MKYGRSLLLTALVTIVVAGMAHRLVTSKLVQPGPNGVLSTGTVKSASGENVTGSTSFLRVS
jgi:hypothetical protein